LTGSGSTGETARVSDQPDLLAANLGADRNPYAAYHESRRAHAVHATEHLGAHVTMVYAYGEADEVLKDEGRFSARINGRWMRPLLGRTILEMDGAEHHKHRRLIGHAFRPRVVQRWDAELIVPTAHDLIDRFAARGEAELVREFTWQLPVRVFAKVLGVPEIDLGRWQGWAVDLERAALDWKRGVAAAKEVEAYFAPVLERRRASPEEDLLSDLVTAELEGERLPDEVIFGFIRLLIPAGAATTYRLLGSTLLALLTDRELLAAVREAPSRIPAAIEESLRWEAPVQFAARESNEDTELGGVAIAAGTPVLVALGAANRDEERYEAPDAYDPGREGPPPHIAFGDGVHRCLGEHLARLEAASALGVLLDRLDGLRLEDEGDPHMFGYAFRSPNRVPVRFKAA